MAARLSPKHDELTRSKIQTSQLINRLQDHVKGKVKLENSQVNAAKILLSKTLPDLANTTISGDKNNPVAIRVEHTFPATI